MPIRINNIDNKHQNIPPIENNAHTPILHPTAQPITTNTTADLITIQN